MYSLEAVHLTGSLCKKLNAFHLRGLRKILRVQTTFVNRQNANERVYQTVSDIAFPLGNVRIKPFTEIWAKDALNSLDTSFGHKIVIL